MIATISGFQGKVIYRIQEYREIPEKEEICNNMSMPRYLRPQPTWNRRGTYGTFDPDRGEKSLDNRELLICCSPKSASQS